MTYFIYLSQILNLPVINAHDRRTLGYLHDIAAIIGPTYPKASALVVRMARRRQVFYMPWSSVRQLAEGKSVIVEYTPDKNGNRVQLLENEILLRGTFYDKQIVDISGSKVVRANDLHFIREDLNLWLVHIDVGFKGFLRRLGWLRPFAFLVKWLFSYDLKDRFIPWKYVQPTSMQNVFGDLSLTVPNTKLDELHPADLADILADIGTEERLIIFRALGDTAAAQTLQELPLKMRIQIAGALPIEQLASIVNEMPMDEVVDLLAEFSRENRAALYRFIPPERVADIKELLSHSSSIAGSLMNTEFIAIKHRLTAGEALSVITSVHQRAESFYYIYVVDDDDCLRGVVTLRHLLVADGNTHVSELMHKNVIKVEVDTDVKKVARIFFKYNFMIVPVVDDNDRIEGIITIKDALEAVFPEIREEAEES